MDPVLILNVEHYNRKTCSARLLSKIHSNSLDKRRKKWDGCWDKFSIPCLSITSNVCLLLVLGLMISIDSLRDQWNAMWGLPPCALFLFCHIKWALANCLLGKARNWTVDTFLSAHCCPLSDDCKKVKALHYRNVQEIASGPAVRSNSNNLWEEEFIANAQCNFRNQKFESF